MGGCLQQGRAAAPFCPNHKPQVEIDCEAAANDPVPQILWGRYATVFPEALLTGSLPRETKDEHAAVWRLTLPFPLEIDSAAADRLGVFRSSDTAFFGHSYTRPSIPRSIPFP